MLCVDEKAPIQALERTQPTLPRGLGYGQGYTHDYVRHGTPTLCAALDTATGRVIAQCKQRHRHQKFRAFLRLIDQEVPADLDIHLVVDNYATHKQARVQAGLDARPRYHWHCTPTCASWRNQGERGFGLIAPRALQRHAFRPVQHLGQTIEAFTEHYNAEAHPFVWTATAQSILDKGQRLSMHISGTPH